MVAGRLRAGIALAGTAGPAQIGFYERMLRECPPDVRAGTAASMSNMDLLDALSRLTIPTLVLAGDEDRLTPPAHARRIAAALPNATDVVELPRTGHMAPLERAAEVNYWLHALAARADGSPARRRQAVDAA